ncbi:MAG: IgGFc-binding protein [Deltaproteobacteria bacterium]|nr:IgGFc-binding protein [Deltaproteobacteria bacterium]
MRHLGYGWLLGLVVALAGCSAGSGGSHGPSPGTSSSGNGGASSSSGEGAGGGLELDAGMGDAAPDKLGCSPDLQHVIDAHGTIVKTCAPEQGCSAGTCVPPCQAAADSKGNVGCDFTVATPHFYVGIKPPCFAAFLANAWPKDAKITVSRGGQTYDTSQFGRIADANPNTAGWAPVPPTGVPKDKVAVLFLSQDPASFNATPLTCPVPPAINQGNGSAVVQTGRGQAWRIQTDVPVSTYDILPYGGAKSYLPSAELVIPTSAWGTNYFAVLPRDSAGPPWGQLVATEATTVKIFPNVGLPGGAGVDAAPAQQQATFLLGAGEYIQWQLAPGQDMSGTVIQSDKPVAFTGGNGYICYQSQTSSGGGCDSAHQQIPPISAFGSEYVAPPYATRGNGAESIPYRLVGAVKDTTLAYDPPVPGAPAAIGAGQVVEFETTLAFAVSSQDADHPFYVGQIMTGCMVPGNPNSNGDEEYVNVLPPAQWLARYVFFTDPTYPTTNLVFTRMATATGFKEVKLDCLGQLGGWIPVGAGGKYEVMNVDLIRFGQPNGACANGPHQAESEGPFGLMVWGLDWFSSYGYPAGGSVAPINTVVVPPVPK